MQIRIGTRKSALAIIQANMVMDAIKIHFPKAECVLVPIVTSGDKITDKNLYDIGGKALFLKELEIELLENNIDIAVHSLKDVPGILSEGLSIEAVLKRHDPRDCFVSLKYQSIDDLPTGSTVGTSSVRRKIILQQKRPDLKIVQFRGNVNTRINKLKNNEVDATILAIAGLERAGLYNDSYCYPIDVHQMLPAAGQGIIAVEIKNGNQDMYNLCKKINHSDTWHISLAEHSFLEALDASCRTPIAAYAILDDEKIKAHYMLSDEEGNVVKYHTEIADINSAANMGKVAAKEILTL